MTIATRRRFPSDPEIDAWLAEHLINPEHDGPHIDQLKAASDDVDARLRAAAPMLVAAGRRAWAFIDGRPVGGDTTPLRPVARMVMAAESAGIRDLCEHVHQVRPLLLSCDPPAIVCYDCAAAPHMDAIAGPPRWNHQCDRCGTHARMLTPVTHTGLGHITVCGHLCRPCTTDDRSRAAKLADRVELVGRRRPCPCGSGRQFRKCCERFTTGGGRSG